MSSKIDFQHYCPSNNLKEEKTFQTITTHHLKPNNRKNSLLSIETKTSDQNQCSDLELIDCEHISSSSYKVCQKCGIFFIKNTDIEAIKTNRFYGIGWSIQNLRLLSKKFQTKEVKPLDFMSRDVIQKASEIFGFSLTTQALGVYIYYSVFQGINEFLEVCISLFVAAKLLEHTTAKSLRRYRKYLNKCFKISDYQEIESFILQKMNFEVNIPTFMDFIFCYLHQGITLSHQQTSCIELQDQIIFRSKQILFKGTFMLFEPEVVASNILFSIRKDIGSKQPWSQGIKQITELNDPYFIFSNQQPDIPLQLI